MPAISSLRLRVTLNGSDVTSSGFTVTRGTYGSNGSFRVTASISDNDVDIVAIAKNTGTSTGTKSAKSIGSKTPDTRTTVQIEVSTDGGQTFFNVLTGDLDSISWEFDQNTLELIGRDFSGRLVESRVVLKNSQLVNMTPSQLATQFANDAGLVPNVTAIPGEQVIGYLGENNLAIRTGTPISKWNLLVLMARLTARAVWVSSDNPPVLYFGPVITTPTPKPLVYGGNDPSAIPIRNLTGEYRLFKNTTFQVIVMSYHPKSQQPAQASVLVAGEEIQYETFKTIPAGMYKGGAAGSLRLQLGNVLRDKPAYFFYAHALSPQQCNTLAEAIARDIAKREFILKGTIDGDITVNPLDPITVTMAQNTPLIRAGSDGTKAPVDIRPFSGRQMYVAEVHHTFDFAAGFQTHLSMWYLPSAASVLADLPTPSGLVPVTPQPIE